jgi:hypothetical protein
LYKEFGFKEYNSDVWIKIIRIWFYKYVEISKIQFWCLD